MISIRNYSFGSYFILFLVELLHGIKSPRVQHKIYTKLLNNNQCFRIFNATHQFGCQSKRFGDTGIVHFVNSSSDVNWILQDFSGRAPYIAVLNMKMWSDGSVVQVLRESDNVAGIVILFEAETDTKSVPGYSSDRSCPNRYSSFYGEDKYCTSSWNKYGRARWFHDWKFPIFLLEDPSEIAVIKYCYEQYNKPINGKASDYPLCSVTLRFWMLAAKDSKTCIRRGTLFNGLETGQHVSDICDPISGENIFFLFPSSTNKSDEIEMNTGSVFVLASRVDSFSMFSDVSPGVESATGSLISILAVCEALGKNRTLLKRLIDSGRESGKYVLVSLFDAESFDYTGSTRMLYDMRNGVFPSKTDEAGEQLKKINFSHFGFFLEVNQLNLAENNRFFAHVDGAVYKSGNRQLIDNIVSTLNSTRSGRVELVPKPEFGVLPSSSYQRFLRENASLPGLVLTDFQDNEFKAKFYNSFADRKYQFEDSTGDREIDNIFAVSESLLQTVTAWLNGSTFASSFSINRTVVKNLFDCFVRSSILHCDYFSRAVGRFDHYEKDAKKHPLMLTYTGPRGYHSIVPFISTRYLLPWYLGERVNIPEEECSSGKQKDFIHSYHWLKEMPDAGEKTVCVKSNIFGSIAESPAFDIEDYKWNSNEYPTWTESEWYHTEKEGSNQLKVFLIGNPSWGLTVFAIGICTVIISFFLVLIINRNLHLLFEPTPADV